MKVEHDTKMFALDENFQANIAQMNAEGWLALPGTKAVAIFFMVRIQQDDPNAPPSGAGPSAQVHIDDSKVSIYRDGKPLDGTQDQTKGET